MEKIIIRSSKRIEFIDITLKVQEVLNKTKINSGVCFIFCPHTTAGLTINENADPSVKTDILSSLSKIVPANAGYAHTEGNADSHIKSSLLGCCLTVFFEDGQLQLGTWQGIYFCEGDGPRQRQVWVKVIQDNS